MLIIRINIYIFAVGQNSLELVPETNLVILRILFFVRLDENGIMRLSVAIGFNIMRNRERFLTFKILASSDENCRVGKTEFN